MYDEEKHYFELIDEGGDGRDHIYHSVIKLIEFKKMIKDYHKLWYEQKKNEEFWLEKCGMDIS
jgi:hypothetical protein